MNTELLKILDNNNIHLLVNELDNEIKGYHFSTKAIDLIGINETIVNNKKLYNDVLSEELGHYFTSVGDFIPLTDNSYSDDIKYFKSENKALKWAVNFTIDTEKLLLLIDNYDAINKYEISEYFDVSEDFVMMKFYYMSKVKNSYKLNNEGILVLSNYPSVFIYYNYEEEKNGKCEKTC